MTLKQSRFRDMALLLAVLALVGCEVSAPSGEDHVGLHEEDRRPFAIEVIDRETGRGVPLVELETVNHVLFVTDSAGRVAVAEPEFKGQEVWFSVRSHGYELPADGFGYRGFRAKVEPGGSRRVILDRVNVAERLYRVTGAGIYRDSFVLGEPVPLREPILSGGVLGQDSVVNALYRGKYFWFWGDTSRASYPLGNFAVSGALSDSPLAGGLDPAMGVDLQYFTDEHGFSRGMCPLPAPGAVWIGGLMLVEEDGVERLVCHFSRMKSLGDRLEHGIAVWSDEREVFEKRASFDLDAPLHPIGHPLRIRIGEDDHWYFQNPFPVVRVRNRIEDILDPSRYESFTCLKSGSRSRVSDASVERDPEGALVWAWRPDTAALDPTREQELVQNGQIRADERQLRLVDLETGSEVRTHGGSVAWNDFRKRWIMIALEIGGRSFLGEVWYAESETIDGPWSPARRIVTHDDYSFYNVKQHPLFNGENGRFVYFEGTYTAMFSNNRRPTPRYDYNQIMYRLDLADPRLHLP